MTTKTRVSDRLFRGTYRLGDLGKKNVERFEHCPECKSGNVSSSLRYATNGVTILGGHQCLDCGWMSEGYMQDMPTLSHWKCFACKVFNLTTLLVCRNCHKRRWQHLGLSVNTASSLLKRIGG